MKLFFTCPIMQKDFATEDYALQEGHRIAEDEHGGKTLMGFVSLNSAYLKTIKEMGPDLWQLIFVNSGVKLTTASSPVLEELQGYEKLGGLFLPVVPVLSTLD